MVKLSICITAYNQSELLRKNLENLLRYPDGDVEFVVSDNCSTEDIRTLTESFHDPRIRYCRTEHNVGQDGNILNAFRHCSAPYAFLLRTKDTLLPEKIPAVIETVCAHPEVGYWRFNCVDETGKPQSGLSDAIYPAGEPALRAQNGLMVHPSGEAYHLAYLTPQELDVLDGYRARYFPDNMGFVMHDLLRYLLLSRAALGTSSAFVWVYLSGKASVTGTVNKTVDRKSVYHPDYTYPRYACEMEYIAKELPPEHRLLLHRLTLRRYCQAATVAFKYINRDKASQAHYGCAEQPFSVSAERRAFRRKTLELIRDYPPQEQRELKRYARFCLTVMQLRWEASHFLGPLIKTKLLGALALRRAQREKKE